MLVRDRIPELVDPALLLTIGHVPPVRRQPGGLVALLVLSFLFERLDAVERAKGGQRDDRHRDAGLDDLPEEVPLDVDRGAGVAVDGLARRAQEADGEHANGEAEEGVEEDLLAEPDLDFPEEANGDGDDCGRRKEDIQHCGEL